LDGIDLKAMLKLLKNHIPGIRIYILLRVQLRLFSAASGGG
jgi:hypothetical protein